MASVGIVIIVHHQEWVVYGFEFTGNQRYFQWYVFFNLHKSTDVLRVKFIFILFYSGKCFHLRYSIAFCCTTSKLTKNIFK